jgi:hypothetical protein
MSRKSVVAIANALISVSPREEQIQVQIPIDQFSVWAKRKFKAEDFERSIIDDVESSLPVSIEIYQNRLDSKDTLVITQNIDSLPSLLGFEFEDIPGEVEVKATFKIKKLRFPEPNGFEYAVTSFVPGA